MKIKWTLFMTIGFAVAAAAQEKTLRLEDLVRTALERNPKIKSTAYSAEAQKARIVPEGTLPDPVLSFGVKNMGIDRWAVGMDPQSGVAVSVAQAVPFPGKLKLKSEMADQRAQQADQGVRSQKLAVVREVKDLFAKLFYYRKSAELLAQKKGILTNALQTAESKYAVGSAAQSDIFKAQVEISGIEDMLLAMTGMIRATEATLNGLLDLPSDSPIGVPEEIALEALPLDLKTIQAEAGKNSPA
jgi:cobalt-zinc-cadmium efflux system outer membrane protein